MLSLQFVEIPEGETVERREVMVPEVGLTIGRGFDCDLQLGDHGRTLSRLHLQVVPGGPGGASVIDHSSNGTELNGARLRRGTPCPIADGDLLRLAGYTALVSLAAKGAAATSAPEPGATDVFALSDLGGDEAAAAPLVETAPRERLPAEPDTRLGDADNVLDAPDLFDPFAEDDELGPVPPAEPPRTPAGMADADDARDPVAATRADRIAPEATDLVAAPPRRDPDAGLVTPERLAALTAELRREAERDRMAHLDRTRGSLERALAAFLDEFAPERLQAEFDDCITGWGNREKRYWRLYRRRFARKRETGELEGQFLGLFYREMMRR